MKTDYSINRYGNNKFEVHDLTTLDPKKVKITVVDTYEEGEKVIKGLNGNHIGREFWYQDDPRHD